MRERGQRVTENRRVIGRYRVEFHASVWNKHHVGNYKPSVRRMLYFISVQILVWFTISVGARSNIATTYKLKKKVECIIGESGRPTAVLELYRRKPSFFPWVPPV